MVEMNSSVVHVTVREINDSALIMMIKNGSHVVYWREESGGVRLTIDNQSCFFPLQKDPSKLQAESAGKLLRFLFSSPLFTQTRYSAPLFQLSRS